jgi:PAS domain S-box-containing protein
MSPRSAKIQRDEAVQAALAGQRSVLELALQLGVSTTTLRNWMRRAQIRTDSGRQMRRVATALGQGRQDDTSQRMRLLVHALEQSPATIIVTDAEGRILYANPKFVETTGYSVEEVIGQTPRFLKSGHTSQNTYGELWRTLGAGREWRGVFQNRRKDGTLYWERASISPVFDAEGRIANFMAVKENITEFVQADAARRQTEERMQALVAALPEGVLLLERTGRILLANPAMADLLGCRLEELPGLTLDGAGCRWIDTNGTPMPPAVHPACRAIDHGEAVRDERCGLVKTNGRTVWLSISAVPVQTEHGTSMVVVSCRATA